MSLKITFHLPSLFLSKRYNPFPNANKCKITQVYAKRIWSYSGGQGNDREAKIWDSVRCTRQRQGQCACTCNAGTALLNYSLRVPPAPAPDLGPSVLVYQILELPWLTPSPGGILGALLGEVVIVCALKWCQISRMPCLGKDNIFTFLFCLYSSWGTPLMFLIYWIFISCLP